MTKSIFTWLAAGLFVSGAFAQTPLQSRNEQLNSAQAAAAQDTGVQRKEIVDKAQMQAQPAKINIAPSKTGVGVIDPEAIARQYSQIKTAPTDSRDADTNELMVFVSLSMPTGSLERAARDSRKAGAALVMRGVSKGVGPGRWVQSMAALEPLTKNGGEVSLHPDLFERYGIRRVPAIVVAADPSAGCSDDSCRAFAVIYGDVSLAYALERLADRKDVIGSISRQRLTKLEQR